MMVNPINRLNMNRSAYQMIAVDNSSMNKTFTSDMANASLNYKASSLMEASQKRATDENIKRTFSIFA